MMITQVGCYCFMVYNFVPLLLVNHKYAADLDQLDYLDFDFLTLL